MTGTGDRDVPDASTPSPGGSTNLPEGAETGMLYLVITSLVLNLFAMMWAIVLLRRLRDWRLAFVVGALALVGSVELGMLLIPVRLVAEPITTLDVVARVAVLTVAVLVLLSVYAFGAMIGDRERFVRLARENKERYRKLVDSIGVITWEADVATLRFTFVSGRAEAILGYPLDQWYGKDFWVDHLHEEDRGWVPEFCHSSMLKGEDYEFEYRMVAADGRAVWLQDVVSVTMRDGKPWRIHGAMLDITKRKAAEESHRNSEERYRQMFELSPQPMWVFDQETLRFLAVNDAATSHYGYSRQEFLAKTILDIRPPEDVPVLLEMRRMNAGKKRSGVWRHLTKDGRILDVDVSTDVVTFEGRQAQLVIATDITEQKQAEEERRALAAERERLLQRLKIQFDNMPVGCILADREGVITDWNPAAERMFGWSREEAIGKTILDLLVPDYVLPTLSDVVHRIKTGTGTVYNTNENKTRDGRIIMCDWQNTPVRHESDKFDGLLCTVQDVTERLAAEEALRRSESRLRRVFSGNVIGIVFWTAEGRITDANEVFLHMLGYSREDLESGLLGGLKLTPPEFAWLDERAKAEMAATGVCAPYDKEFVRKDGTRVPVLMGAGMFDNDSESGVAFVADITQLKKARELFRQSEERYRRLAEHGAMGIWEVRRDGKTVFANPAMCQMLEVSDLNELRQLDYREFFSPESLKVMEHEQQRRFKGEQSTYEVELIGRQGGRRSVMISGAPVVTPGQELETFLGTFTDVTGMKLAEEALRQSQKMDAVGQLASGVAHDFNNLITAIFGYTSLARRTLSPNHPATRALDRVDAAARQAAGVTRGLLTFSRESSAEKKPIQLGRAVLDTVQLLRRMLPPNIELRAKLENEKIDWIYADSTQIQQVVMNLAINARDAMPEGGRLNITVAAARPEHGLNGDTARYVALKVEDSGHGMSPAVMARIFEPFFTTKPPGQGTGLGLPIIHGIVKDHEGSVSVQSTPGQGSTVTVLLPRCEAAPEAGDGRGCCESLPGRGEIILLVEDQSYVREILATMLQSLGYKVVQCPNQEAFAAALETWKGQAHLLIVDWDQQTGRCPTEESAACLQQRGTSVPTILMVADTEGMYEDGKRTFLLRKPFQMSELAAAVTRALVDSKEPLK